MQTILSFDFGLKKIGIAVGNSHTKSAQILASIANSKNSPHFEKLDKLINEWKPDLLVVGMPLNMDGTESKLCQQVKIFGNALGNRYNLQVEYEDERLSSNQADLLLRETLESNQGLSNKMKNKRDQIAAKLILQSYFNRS